MPNDERRERYEAAIGAEDIQNIYVIRAAARAAMAVANREQQELNAESSNASRYLFERDAAQGENARLRASIEKIRAVLDSDPGWTALELKRRVRTTLTEES